MARILFAALCVPSAVASLGKCGALTADGLAASTGTDARVEVSGALTTTVRVRVVGLKDGEYVLDSGRGGFADCDGVLSCGTTRCTLPGDNPMKAGATVMRGATVRAAYVTPAGSLAFLKPVTVLPAVVNWHLHVGCDKTGFFTELLGMAGALGAALRRHSDSEFRISGVLCDEAERAKLFPEEARVIQALTAAAAEKDREAEENKAKSSLVVEERRNDNDNAPVLKIEHGSVCDNPWPDIARLMVEKAWAPERERKEFAYACAKRAKVVWAPNEWAARQFRAAGARKVLVVPEAVDPRNFVPSEQRKRSTDAPFTILTVARWAPRKNLDLLLEAVLGGYLANANVHLLLHAYVPLWQRADRNLTRIIDDRRRRFCRDDAVCPTVEWTGKDDLDRFGIRNLYRRADAFVLPTLGEGWGLPVHEAMAAGLPVVSTNHSGTAALVGDAGVLLPDHGENPDTGYIKGPTVQELAAGIDYLMSDADRARRLAEAGRQRVTALFSPDAVATIVLDHLEDYVKMDMATPRRRRGGGGGGGPSSAHEDGAASSGVALRHRVSLPRGRSPPHLRRKPPAPPRGGG